VAGLTAWCPAISLNTMTPLIDSKNRFVVIFIVTFSTYLIALQTTITSSNYVVWSAVRLQVKSQTNHCREYRDKLLPFIHLNHLNGRKPSETKFVAYNDRIH
jgi:hypothetical protein